MKAAAALLLALLSPALTFAADAPPGAWSGSASAYWYALPDEDDFILPIVTLRHDRLHLEARYNYEDLSTTSLFAGWAFEAGSSVTWDMVPMLGAVVGRTDGAAPAFTVTLDWKRLGIYSENEYVVDFSDHDANFFYDWSEITVRATEGFALGVTVQRTRTVDTGLDIQRGLMARFTHGPWSAAAYWFNPGSDDRFAVYSAGFEF